MKQDWLEQQARWSRFAAWEADRLHAHPGDFAAALEWLASAAHLAERIDPQWRSSDRARDRWNRLAEMQRALARVRFTG